jgi:hypothetical protein
MLCDELLQTDYLPAILGAAQFRVALFDPDGESNLQGDETSEPPDNVAPCDRSPEEGGALCRRWIVEYPPSGNWNPQSRQQSQRCILRSRSK